MKKNYNELLRFYNRSRKKLSNLRALGKNFYKQDILKRRIDRLFELLKGMQTQFKLSTASLALAAGFAMFQPDAAKAQSFPVKVTNPFGLTNGISQSVPVFVDLDNDGDKDIMKGDAVPNMYYFKNVGTATVPNYTTSVINPFGLPGSMPPYSSPAFADLDNDGDKDLFVGSKNGGWFYYQNTGTAASPAFAVATLNPFGLTTAGGYSSGSFVDLDNDGDKDFVGGAGTGNLYYFQNTGSVSVPAFAAPVTNPFGSTSIAAGYSMPSFIDINSDGDMDMLVGCKSGNFYYYQNTGTVSAPVFAAPSLNPFNLTNVGPGGYSTVSFADLDNDSDLDLISGVFTNASVIYFSNTGSVGFEKKSINSGLDIFPNPTNSDVTIRLNSTSDVLFAEVTNIVGQIVSTIEISKDLNTVVLPEAKGLYFIKLTDAANKSNTYKIVKN